MEKIILRDHLKEIIGNRKVSAALFYTFNFEPRFFENFVMPLLIQGKNFRDEVIHNKILWRQCAKEGLIPPVAVYCDFYAKDHTQAPALGYDIHCVKVPSASGSICNFHSKQIFLLLDDETLLMVTGSGNLTANGWCDNFECFAFHKIKKEKTMPYKTKTNQLQDYIKDVNQLAGLKNFLPAEESIYSFLSYCDLLNLILYNSFTESFQFFLEENIFDKDTINRLEIVSPYFSSETVLIQYLQQKGIKEIRCLIPALRNSEIQLDRETFMKYEKAGLKWSYWADKDLNSEVRNQHSKIYRFYSDNYYYTVIGSLNFTKPAWSGYTKRNNKSNIETIILIKENNDRKSMLLTPLQLDYTKLQFISKPDLENSIDTSQFNRYAPDLEFTIDWKSKLLLIDANLENEQCQFHELFDDTEIANGKSERPLGKTDINQFAKNALIKVKTDKNGKENFYNYYPKQIHIEAKPLDFKLDANIVSKFWQLFEDEYGKENLTRKLCETRTDESGIVTEKNIERKLLLNEMATYYSGIVKLEGHLFSKKLNSKKEAINHFPDLGYYLLSENIDTVSFFLKNLKSKYESGEIQKSFYWMVLQVLNHTVYAKAEKWEYKRSIDKNEWKQFKEDIKKYREELDGISENIVQEIPDLKNKVDWVVKQISFEYD